jgi:hypothetical protein
VEVKHDTRWWVGGGGSRVRDSFLGRGFEVEVELVLEVYIIINHQAIFLLVRGDFK